MTEIDFATLYEPLTEEQYEALRDDIQANGVRHAILVTPDGVVVAGRNRKRIAEELGLDCPQQMVGGSLADQVSAAVIDNPNRRIDREQRVAAERLLREDLDWSYARIGECIGVSRHQVRRDLLANPTGADATVVGKDDRRRPGKRLTPEQVRRRRAAVTFLFRQGYNFETIGPALGIATSTAARDAQELGLTKAGHKRRPTNSMRRDTPAPIDWRSDPDERKREPIMEVPALDPTPPAYRTSLIALDTRHWIECFQGGDFPNRFAWNVHEALEHDDNNWISYVRELLERARAQSEQLLRILNDTEYRDYCMTGTPAIRTSSYDVPKLRVIR